MTDPGRNKAGRMIWFVASRDGGGTYRPVARPGWWAFALAALWVPVCGATGMIGFALTWQPAWLVGMFVAGAIGLGGFAATVARHS